MEPEKSIFIEKLKSVIYKKYVFIASVAVVAAMWGFYYISLTHGFSVGGGHGTKKLCMILTLLEGMIIYRYTESSGDVDEKKRRCRLALIYSAVMSYASWFILEMSCQGLGCEFLFYILETAVILCFAGIVYIFVGKLWLAWMISLTFFFVIGYINIYVIRYHLTPLTFREFDNFTTARGVVAGYDFTPTADALLMIIALVIGVYLCMKYRKTMKSAPAAELRQQIMRRIFVIVVTIIVLFFGFISDCSIFPKKIFMINWKENVAQYGYVSYMLESLINFYNNHIEPDSYSKEKAESIAGGIVEDNATKTTPDIILILNETFYDMSNITTYDADADVMAAYDKLKSEAIYGYAVAQGGTNWSEYEYLTSNSLAIMPDITPFPNLKMKNAKGINSVLKENGYQTYAAHPAPAINYNRGKGYPGLGFDEIHFFDDFKNVEYDGNRQFTLDRITFDNCVDWYNEMGDAPRFCYVLTIQNHGGYDMNDSSFDTVHVEGDYKGNEEAMNEYFSSLKSSCEAFSDFVDHFRDSDRDVIICMVGDHRPLFAEDIMESFDNEDEKTKRLYSTPFIIWSNFGDKKSEDVGYLGLTQLVPYMLGTYNVKADAYYNYIYQMTENIPVLTSYGKYYSADGEIHSYNLHDFSSADSDSSLSLIRDYFYLEYNRVLPNLAR